MAEVVASLPVRRAGIAQPDDQLRPGYATIPFGSPGLNRLTDDRDVDPFSRIPALANVRCRIGKEASP